jgi:hypothetical protein
MRDETGPGIPEGVRATNPFASDAGRAHGAAGSADGADRADRVDRGAAWAGASVGALLSVAIYVGSRRLVDFDVMLIGYAVATVVMAAGLTYRSFTWAHNPPTRRAIVTGARAAAAGPRRAAVGAVRSLALQGFIRRRGLLRWMAHQSLMWGVLLAAAATFPLTFGWIRFRAVPGRPSAYAAYVLGVRAGSFDTQSIAGFLTFHVLSVAAVLVLAGCAYFGYRRLRAPSADQRSTFHLGPLAMLAVISVTGLALTVSAELLDGRFYRPLALVHMIVVGVGLVALPFGKLFHPLQRPVAVGVGLTRERETGEPVPCRSCGAPLGTAALLTDLEATLAELGLPSRTGVCPACKRLERGAAYRALVKQGYR